MIISEKKECIYELKTKLKNKYPELTKNDLQITNDNVKNMLSLVAYKLRKSKEEMSIIIENL